MKPFSTTQKDQYGFIISERKLEEIKSLRGQPVRNKSGQLVSWTGNNPHHWQSLDATYATIRGGGWINSSYWLSQQPLPEGTVPSYDFPANKHRLRVNSVSLDLAELLATRKETIGMVSSAAMNIAKAAMDVRRGKIGRAADRLGISKPKGIDKSNMPGNWLALQYGWSPLLGDIHSAIAEDVIKEIPPTPVRTTLKGERNYRKWTQRGDTYVTAQIAETLVIRYTTLLKPRVSTFNAMSQLGITNPALLAWNLLPYSFVVDWFYPVGDALEALSACHGVDIVESSIAQSGTSKRVYSGRDSLMAGYRATVKQAYKTRQPGFPGVEFPRVQNPLSTQHFANGMALLTEAFRRKAK